MAYLNKKDEEVLFTEIQNEIKKKLLNSFKNQQGKLVEELETVNVYELEIDEEKSDRDTILIPTIIAAARVWVRFHPDGKSNDSLNLRNDKVIVFKYDDDLKQYKFSNADEVNFFIK